MLTKTKKSRCFFNAINQETVLFFIFVFTSLLSFHFPFLSFSLFCLHLFLLFILTKNKEKPMFFKAINQETVSEEKWFLSHSICFFLFRNPLLLSSSKSQSSYSICSYSICFSPFQKPCVALFFLVTIIL